MLLYLLEFLVFAFVGWIIDSLYSSIEKKRLIFSGYFRGIPLCPIYGFGGILLFNSFELLSAWPIYFLIPMSTFLIVALEYAGGVLSEHLLDERLWDYSGEEFNLNGYISLWHSFLWLILTTVFYLTLFIPFRITINYLEPRLRLDSSLEVLLLFVILIFSFLLTSHHRKLRLKKILDEELKNINSLNELFDFKKWQKLAEVKKEEILKKWDVAHLMQSLKNLKDRFPD